MKYTITIKRDGTIETMDEVPFEELQLQVATISQERVSHIWPANLVKHIAFRLLRWAFGDTGLIAQWTRNWRGPWTVVIIASREAYTHPSRRVCVAWEKEKLCG